eukprot:651413-Rhodomonas_salina.1
MDKPASPKQKRSVTFDERTDELVDTTNRTPSNGSATSEDIQILVTWNSLITATKCPCCLIPVHVEASNTTSKSRVSCDNAKWKWSGEPPFCCVCAKAKGLGSFSSLACTNCKAFRKKLYVRKGFTSKDCRNCGERREQHVKEGQGNTYYVVCRESATR